MFTVQSTVSEGTFESQFGSIVPIRIHTADSGTSHFKGTVIDYNDIEAIATEKHYATWGFMERDARITYMGWNNIDLVGGTMLYMTKGGRPN